ncbi:lipoprotein-releasing ABC transporter permease subunit [Pseudohalioglobus lutimaris]|uniref:Lipoprotein-releasing system transmembrane subunit, LolC/LolE family n=1 Tax=Pseudohalioglobus lutimaris TaxID=1737061 RepID=A0A2N5X4U9_9GAMM|nr:lipoprotein-releasing ABC transporter permease subunit [Pseudohalioglobus lutimaris]PLW69503.1 lipoprotein-releasing system transmembrane subunit, LolC/LolE family [Pseudohalioglobus lutimaris]
MSASRGHTVSNYAPFIGLRYSFSRKRNRFTSVIAMVSMLGMVLGVASLITVLSVMNGFGEELRGRILSLVPHGFVEARQGSVADWESLALQLTAHPSVLAVSPYITDKVIFANGRSLRGGVLTAIDPELEAGVSRMPQSVVRGSLESLSQRGFNVVMGASLARMLAVTVGDHIEVTVPRLTVTPLGAFPRSKRLTVTGIFEVGAQPDAYQAYIGLGAGQKLLGPRQGVDGLQLKTDDLYAAPDTMRSLSRELPPALQVKDWSQTQGTLFQAVKMEKVMVSLLLLSVVAVAAFNIVSTLIMSVAEKRRDIAVLRTMGARAGGIMAIFVAHGLALAIVGISVGALLGSLLAYNISSITLFVENLFSVKIFDPAVYFISELPSSLLWSDVVAVVFASFVLSLLATLYPAWRAARIAPAEVLRYE